MITVNYIKAEAFSDSHGPLVEQPCPPKIQSNPSSASQPHASLLKLFTNRFYRLNVYLKCYRISKPKIPLSTSPETLFTVVFVCFPKQKEKLLTSGHSGWGEWVSEWETQRRNETSKRKKFNISFFFFLASVFGKFSLLHPFLPRPHKKALPRND